MAIISSLQVRSSFRFGSALGHRKTKEVADGGSSPVLRSMMSLNEGDGRSKPVSEISFADPELETAKVIRILLNLIYGKPFRSEPFSGPRHEQCHRPSQERRVYHLHTNAQIRPQVSSTRKCRHQSNLHRGIPVGECRAVSISDTCHEYVDLQPARLLGPEENGAAQERSGR